jgi:hypothetical protein
MRPNILAPRVLAVTAAAALALFAPAASSAQSTLDASQAQAFLGNWVVSMDTDFGPFSMDVAISDQAGKVAVQVGAPEIGTQEVTNVAVAGEMLVLAWDADAQGQVVDILLSLTPAGENLTASFEAAGGQFFAEGVATRAAN